LCVCFVCVYVCVCVCICMCVRVSSTHAQTHTPRASSDNPVTHSKPERACSTRCVLSNKPPPPTHTHAHTHHVQVQTTPLLTASLSVRAVRGACCLINLFPTHAHTHTHTHTHTSRASSDNPVTHSEPERACSTRCVLPVSGRNRQQHLACHFRVEGHSRA